MSNPYQANLPQARPLDPVEEQLAAAFLDLYVTTPLEKLTIKDLCHQAGLARSTFYHHFNNTWELRARLEDNFAAGIMAASAELPRFDFQAADYPAYIEATTRFLEANRRLFKTFLIDQPTASFTSKHRQAIKYHYYEAGIHDEVALEVIAVYLLSLFRYALVHDQAFTILLTDKYERVLKELVDSLLR